MSEWIIKKEGEHELKVTVPNNVKISDKDIMVEDLLAVLARTVQNNARGAQREEDWCVIQIIN